MLETSMEQRPSQNSAFLTPSYMSRRPNRIPNPARASCSRGASNAQSHTVATSTLQPPQSSGNNGASIRVDDVVEGVVARVTSFGAFVQLPNGQTGLVHISEIANSFIHDINQHVSTGQQVSVRVVSIDRAKNRISLSIRQAAPGPTGYDRVLELGGDWGHPWDDDGQTKFMDLGPRPEPRPHPWEPDLSLFRKWETKKDENK